MTVEIEAYDSCLNIDINHPHIAVRYAHNMHYAIIYGCLNIIIYEVKY